MKEKGILDRYWKKWKVTRPENCISQTESVTLTMWHHTGGVFLFLLAGIAVCFIGVGLSAIIRTLTEIIARRRLENEQEKEEEAKTAEENESFEQEEDEQFARETFQTAVNKIQLAAAFERIFINPNPYVNKMNGERFHVNEEPIDVHKV